MKVDSSKSSRCGTDSLKDYYHPFEPVSRQIREYSLQPISHWHSLISFFFVPNEVEVSHLPETWHFLPYVLNPRILLKLIHKFVSDVEINNSNINSKLQ